MQHTTESIIQKVELFDLPNCVLTKILGNLSYDEIAQRRRVSPTIYGYHIHRESNNYFSLYYNIIRLAKDLTLHADIY